MKKIFIIVFLILILSTIISLGLFTYSSLYLNETNTVDQALDEINNSDTAYIEETYADFGSDLNPTTSITPNASDKQNTLTELGATLDELNKGTVDETGGYNLDLSGI